MRFVGSVTRIPELRFGSLRAPDARSLGRYALELVIIGSSYLVFAKLGWTLAVAVQPGAPPIWPATGLAWAAVLVRGMRIWPAIFISAWAASHNSAVPARSSPAQRSRQAARLGRFSADI